MHSRKPAGTSWGHGRAGLVSSVHLHIWTVITRPRGWRIELKQQVGCRRLFEPSLERRLGGIGSSSLAAVGMAAALGSMSLADITANATLDLWLAGVNGVQYRREKPALQCSQVKTFRAELSCPEHGKKKNVEEAVTAML